MNRASVHRWLLSLIVDAMAVVQALKGRWTFGDVADAIFGHITKLARQWNATRVDVVGDRYPELSIKNAERNRRAANGVQRVHIYSKDQSAPKQWKKFLSSGENKETLMTFLSEHWCTYTSSQLHCNMYVTSEDKCYVLAPSSSPNDAIVREEVSDLQCNHEEADTRLLLHCNHVAATHDRMIIKSPDTDVFVLSIAFQKVRKPFKTRGCSGCL